MTDKVTDPEFEVALATAQEERNLSRANVVDSPVTGRGSTGV